MLSQAALAQFPPVTMRLMHSTAAMQLQAEAEPGHDIGMLWDAAEHWHRAGATDKAIELLRSCAGYCTNIGRPSVACELLQRTLVIAPTEQQQGILLRLIDAAGLAEAYGLLASAIQQLRHATGTESESTIHDALELVELQAKRLCGTSLVDLETRLADCISHPTADSSHRLRAACFLLVAHDLNLDRHGAALAYRLSQSIPCANDVDRLNRVLADLLFNLLIGERVPAARAAHELLARSEKSDSRAASLRFRIDAAMGLFRAAEAHPAIDAMEQAFEASERNGMLSSMLDSSSMLAWMQHTVGDFAAAARWDRLSDQAFARLSRALVQPGGRTGPYFSNKIEFALERADWPAASAWLQKARSAYAEIDAPRSRQLARAFRMRIEQLQHLAGGRIEDLEELASDHALGRECGLHDNFVDAYWHELVRAGLKNKANDMLVEYVTRYRRDGFSLSAPIREIVRVERLALVAKFQPIDQGSESRGGA